MLKRILSAFLLCLCVSPVWAGEEFDKVALNMVGSGIKVLDNRYLKCSVETGARANSAASEGVHVYFVNTDNGKLVWARCQGSEWTDPQEVPYCDTVCHAQGDDVVDIGEYRLWVKGSEGSRRFIDAHQKKVMITNGMKLCKVLKTYNQNAYPESAAVCERIWGNSRTGREWVTRCEKKCVSTTDSKYQWSYIATGCTYGYELINRNGELCRRSGEIASVSGEECSYPDLSVDYWPCPQKEDFVGAAFCKHLCKNSIWVAEIESCQGNYDKVWDGDKYVCREKQGAGSETVVSGEACTTDGKERNATCPEGDLFSNAAECYFKCSSRIWTINIRSCNLNYSLQDFELTGDVVAKKCLPNSSSSSSGVGESSVQGTISESKQRCLASRESGEGKACCHWAKTVAKWENNQCVCVNPNKVFKMNDDGQTGSCVDKPAGSDAGSGGALSGGVDADASQSSDEEYTKPTCGNCVAVGNCSDKKNRDARIDGAISAECDETDNQERRAWGVLQQMYSAGQGRVTGVTVKVGDDTCTVESNSEFNCGEKKYAGCTMVEISGGGYKTITVPLNKITDGGTTSSFICLEPEICNCGTDGEVSDANAVVPGDISGAQGNGGNSGAQGAGGNSASQNAPAKPDGTPCTPTDKNAKSGKYQNGECIIVECNGAYYKVSDDKKSCVEDKKAKSQAKIDELQKNADAMKEKEQSTANKLLGGAAIGATGIGAMQAASAYSEQQADEEAEQAMKAYLATFHCNYGGGINVKGGEKDVQLPGGNELIDLYAEYVNLANNLKVRKAALDLRPGIESEAILDSATSGLYDDVAIGKTSGAFTSLARALQDPEGEDAKAWAAQKDASAKKMKTGLTVAAIGAIGGAVGNLLINRKSEKENSKNILDKYKDGDLTGKVSKSPDGKLVAEPVNQESKPEPGIAIQDKDLGQETNMNQNQSGNWVHIVKPYAVGFYCEDLFENVYRSCFAMNNEDYARFQQSKFSEITNNAEKCYQGLANCKQESHTLARIEEACIRAVASDFSIDVSGVNNANCTDKYKTDFTWKSHIFQEQSTVDADATAIVKDGQMILVSPDPSTGERVETVVEESQESTPKQDNVVKDHHHGDGVDYIKRIENITDANAAFNMLAQQFGKTPSDEVKNTYDGFVTTCRRYNGVLSIELDTLRSYERDMYQVLCYFPDLDQTPDIVKVAYDTDHRVLDNSVSISEEIRLSKLAPFKDTQYKKNEDAFWQRLTEFNSNWSTSSRNCKIPELPSLWACTKYSAMIRIHDRDGKMYLEMTKYDGPAGNSDNYFVGK